MMEWPRYPLREVAPAIPSRNSLDPDDTVWHLGLNQIEGHTGVVLGKHRAPVSDAGNSTFHFDQSHVLYSKLRPYLNKIVVPNEPGIATTELIPLKPHPHLVCREFLAYYLRSPEFLAYASQYVTGAKMPRVILDRFWAHEIALPPLSEQHRIVEILDQAHRLRRLRAKAETKADRILPALFIKMFGDPATNPKGWPSQRFSELTVKFSDGPFGSNLKTSHYTVDGVRVLRLQNIGIGVLLDDDKVFVSTDHFSSLSKHQCLPGDVIVATLGDPNLRALVLPPHIPQVLNKADCVQIRPKPGSVTSEYICWLLNTPSTARMAERLIHGQTRTRISMGLLKGLSIPVPDYELQLRFASHARAVTRAIAKRERMDDRLEKLWNVLLHRAFTGEITATWREGHMKDLVRKMERSEMTLAHAAP